MTSHYLQSSAEHQTNRASSTQLNYRRSSPREPRNSNDFSGNTQIYFKDGFGDRVDLDTEWVLSCCVQRARVSPDRNAPKLNGACTGLNLCPGQIRGMLGLKISNLLYQERASCQVKRKKTKPKKTSNRQKKGFHCKKPSRQLGRTGCCQPACRETLRVCPETAAAERNGAETQFCQLWSRTPAKNTSENPLVLPPPGRRAPTASLDPTPPSLLKARKIS